MVFIIAVVAEKNPKVESSNKIKDITEDEILHQNRLKDQIRNIERTTSPHKEDFVVKVNVAAELKELKNRTREYKDTKKLKEIKEVRKHPKHEPKLDDKKGSRNTKYPNHDLYF